MSSTVLVRNFLICGLDVTTGLEAVENGSGGGGDCGSSSCSGSSRSSTASSSDFNPMERAYQPTLLRIMPQRDLGSCFNPDAMSRLLMPEGLRFCTEREIANCPNKSHSFVVTKANGDKLYGVSLSFYEEVTDSNICHAVHTLQKMYSTEAEGGTLKRTDRVRPRSARAPSERSRSLPRHYQQSRLSTSTLDLSSATYDYRKNTLYVTKAIAVLCSEPLVSIAHQILSTMQKYIQKSDFDIQVLEGLVSNLVNDIPVPNNGRSVRFWCLGDAVTLSMPRIPLELPLFDYNLLDFFDILGIENAISLFICILLEHQVLVYSKECDKLMLVCESVTALLYPFAWQHVYVPILPPNLENFLDAPVPYVMGLLRRTHDLELSKKGCVCIVDIDNGELELPEEIPEFPYQPEFIDEIRNTIVQFGGKDGAIVLKEHAIETRENLESSNGGGQSQVLDNSDTMEQLNQMINKFESISAAKPFTGGGPKYDRLKLNNALREVFCNRFVHMFLSYEHFVILADESDSSLTPQQQETQQNFDKISFLSDQKQSHLPFLSGFLETQMFSTFIDECIDKMSQEIIIETPFDIRLVKLKDRFGDSLVRTPTYEPCDKSLEISSEALTKRLKKVELTVTPQKSNQNAKHSAGSQQRQHQKTVTPGVFPLLDPSKFEGKTNSAIFVRGDRKSKSIDPGLLPSQKISLLNASPAAIAEANWTFVHQLLKECKSKTKRILLEKLGQEAVEWGHGAQFSGSEENMLVASVCDLIERIWSHGLQNRQGKSSLWHFLHKFGRANEKLMRFKGTLGTQSFYSPLIKSKPFLLPDHARPVQVLNNPNRRTPTFDSTLMAMVHNVSTIHEIKTDIGYARAWIRLALERKCLSKFLHVLASDPVLLKHLYKRYSFLRSEDEREQSLYYLETLTTVEFSCFTNAYPNSSLLYQVLIFPSSKSGHNPCTSNVWIHVVGSYGETSIIRIPRGTIHFSFWTKNLGVITSMRVGHDNAGSTPNWLIEHVLLRNEFTGQTYKFSCGRWLGQSVDDGSTERYLVGYPVAKDANLQNLVQICAYPPEHACPALAGKAEEPENEIVELQTRLGDAINRIIKFYHKSLNEKISYAHLMCGEHGLVHALIHIFTFGFKSARLFGRNLSVWDFFLKVTMDFNNSMAHFISQMPNSPLNSPKRGSNTLENPRRNSSLSNLLDSPKRTPGSNTPQNTLPRAKQFTRMYTKLVTRIETTCSRLGKDDKFQLFVCLAAYDRLLGKIITDLTKAIAAQQLYEENSFLRNPNLASFLTHILEALEDISVPVDPAMKATFEEHNLILTNRK